MGKQVNFYMTHTDEQSFLIDLRAGADLAVALNHFATPEPESIETLPPAGPAWGNETNMSIYNKAIGPKLFVYEVASRGEFALDLTRSEVIQLNRSFIRADGRLEPGRLWYDHETMRCRPKRKVFLVWAQRVFHIMKKNYHYDGVLRRYFGPEAQRLFNEGQIALAPY